MKSFLIVSFFVMILGGVSAQPGNILNVKETTSQILHKLIPSLGLTEEQQPQVEAVVSDFLTKKVAILPMKVANPSDYIPKFNLLNASLIGKLKATLSARQMTSFLGLKPKTDDTSNVLSFLFY